MTFAVALLLLAGADAGRAPVPPIDRGYAPWPDGGQPLVLPALPFEWELPKKTMHETPIEGTTYVMGVPVRLRYVMVNDTPEEIGRHFLQSFKRQGLFIEDGQAYDRMLTGVDPQSVTTYSVVLQPNAPGYTTVILGEAKPMQKKPVTAGGLPVPPGVKTMVPVRFEGSALLQFSAPGDVAALKAYYARELPLRGYQPKDGRWVKGGELLEVTLEAESREQTKVLLKQTQLQ